MRVLLLMINDNRFVEMKIVFEEIFEDVHLTFLRTWRHFWRRPVVEISLYFCPCKELVGGLVSRLYILWFAEWLIFGQLTP